MTKTEELLKKGTWVLYWSLPVVEIMTERAPGERRHGLAMIATSR